MLFVSSAESCPQKGESSLRSAQRSGCAVVQDFMHSAILRVRVVVQFSLSLTDEAQ